MKMDERMREQVAEVRASIRAGRLAPSQLRGALAALPLTVRDAWLDGVLELGSPPEDGPELPVGGVPYVPCAVHVLQRLVEQARVLPADVFVDIGAGVGRAATLVHLLTGAPSIGIEVQTGLIQAARQLSKRLGLSQVSFVAGDACERPEALARGSVFLLYCPFSGARLRRLLEQLEAIARARTLRVGCVDLPLPPCPWLAPIGAQNGDLVVYRSLS